MQQLADAEAAAANILRDVTVPALHCEGDPGPLYSVAATAAAVPAALGEPRRQAAERLHAIGAEIGSMVKKFKSAVEALQRACGALDWMADKKRSLVSRAFSTHEAACEEADRTDELLVRFQWLCSQCACGVMQARLRLHRSMSGGGAHLCMCVTAVQCIQRKGMPHNGVDADPWGSQAVLSNRENGLLVSQQTQRGVVSDANEQVRSRFALCCHVLSYVFTDWGDVMVCVQGADCSGPAVIVPVAAEVAEPFFFRLAGILPGT